MTADTLTLFALSQFVFAGIAVVSMQGVLGEAFYRSLKLNWHTNLLSDQRLGGVIVSISSALAMLIVVVILTVQRIGRVARDNGLAPIASA